MAFTKYPSGATILTITANASANTEGTYGELAASTAAAASKWFFGIRNANLGSRFALVDFATGAAASESVVVADMPYDSGSDNTTTLVELDVDIAASTRISSRCQSSTGSTTFDVWVLLVDRALGSITAPATYGAVAASSRGTTIDCGATPDTDSAYVQLTASTSATHHVLNTLTTNGTAGESIGVFQTHLLDIATGAGGAETVIIPDQVIASNPTTDCMHPKAMRVTTTVASGTRIAAKAQCSVGTAGDRVIAVTVIGMQDPTIASSSSSHSSVFFG